MASAPGAAFISPLLALLAEPMRPICKLDAEPIAGGGVRDPEAIPKGLWDAVNCKTEVSYTNYYKKNQIYVAHTQCVVLRPLMTGVIHGW